ncbi:heavy-metal-associated domain-containing protein [Muribacter muris]|nr:heavy metal-associated domain-containing protein [Muribacter muris]
MMQLLYQTQEENKMVTTTLKLGGLHCQHCVKSVENALNQLPTVRRVSVDLAAQTAVIESEEEAQTLIDTVIDIGFDAKI